MGSEEEGLEEFHRAVDKILNAEGDREAMRLVFDSWERWMKAVKRLGTPRDAARFPCIGRKSFQD